jgi:hypothetical protein
MGDLLRLRRQFLKVDAVQRAIKKAANKIFQAFKQELSPQCQAERRYDKTKREQGISMAAPSKPRKERTAVSKCSA